MSRFMITLAAIPVIAASQVTPDGDGSGKCSARFGSPLIVHFDGEEPQAMQDVVDIDLEGGWIGSPDAKIKLKPCDRSAWHCLELPGAPLFVPRPYVAAQREWSAGAMTYRVGDAIALHQAGRTLATPIFAFERVEGAGPSPQRLRAIFLFDPGMSLVGYGARSGTLLEPGSFEEVNMNWIVEGEASLQCM